MFTLSGLILETRENIFRDFWSLFSISFYFSSERNYLKKTKPTMGRTRVGLRPGAPLYSAAPEPPAHTSPAPDPPDPPPTRRSCTPPEVRRRLDFRAVFFKYLFSFSSVLFLNFFFIILFILIIFGSG